MKNLIRFKIFSVNLKHGYCYFAFFSQTFFFTLEKHLMAFFGKVYFYESCNWLFGIIYDQINNIYIRSHKLWTKCISCQHLCMTLPFTEHESFPPPDSIKAEGIAPWEYRTLCRIPNQNWRYTPKIKYSHVSISYPEIEDANLKWAFKQ